MGITIASALLQARGGAQPSSEELVSIVQDVEAQCIGGPTGIQDYWAAVNGGINLFAYPAGKPQLTTLPLAALPEIADQLLICFSGRSRLSGINNWEIYKAVMEKQPVITEAMTRIGRLSEQCRQAVEAGNWQQVLEYSCQEWEVRRTLCPGIETEETIAIDQAARKAGAHFSRICGAGGGGVMVVFMPAERRAKVSAAVVAAGGEILASTLTDLGLRSA